MEDYGSDGEWEVTSVQSAPQCLVPPRFGDPSVKITLEAVVRIVSET